MDPTDSCPGLIFPRELLPEERDASLKLVSRCPAAAQPLLDELAARLMSKSISGSPVAYLRAIVDRALAGTFVPQAGLRITAARRVREEETRIAEARNAAMARVEAERRDPEVHARIAARLAELRAVLSNPQRKEPPK